MEVCPECGSKEYCHYCGTCSVCLNEIIEKKDNDDLVKEEIKNILAEMGREWMTTEMRSLLCDGAGYQVHLIVTKEEDDFIDSDGDDIIKF